MRKMPILRMKEIRKIKHKERLERLQELRVELSKLKSTVESGGNIENPARIREIKRTIAKILTVQREERQV